MLQWLMVSNYDNTANYIIVCFSTNLHDCDELELFQAIANSYIANVVFLKVSQDKNNVEPYSFHPLLPDKCWNYDPERLDMTDECPNNTCFKSMFPGKFYNLYQCPLIISTFEQPPFMYLNNETGVPSGGDGDVLRMVSDILNASLVVKTPVDGPDWGHYQNNNWTGSLGAVYNNHAHGSMCSSPLTPGKYGNFQISFTYNSMDMVWTSGLPAIKPSWEKLLYPFAFYTRVALLFTFIGIIFMNKFAATSLWKNITRSIKVAPTRLNLLFYSWTVFLGMPILKAPARITFQCMFFGWIWFSFVLRGVYQGALVGSLKLQVFEDNLDNFGEVLKQKYPFGGLPSLREYYTEDTEIYDNWKSVGLTEAYDYLDHMAEGNSNFVIALNRETVIDYLIQYGGKKHLQILPEKIVNSPTVIFFKRNSHLTAPVSHFLTVFLEGGFTQRLYQRYLSHSKLLFYQSKTHGPEPLRLEHFTGCLFILMLGYMLSIIFFVIEFLCGKK